jgi:hypothetical protein
MYKEILDKVPAYKEFMAVSELDHSSQQLANEYDNVELVELGKSTSGRPILCLKIGEGKRNALLFAFPHPNEPIGSLTVEFLSQFLAEHSDITDQFGYTWYMIKAIDPEGAALNEGWFKGEFDPVKFARHYYRPAPHEQIEWTFPVKYKKLNFSSPTLETQALIKIIDQIKPEFMFSLHNAGFCGVYYYVTHAIQAMFPKFQNLVNEQKLPLHRGEPETPYLKKLDAGIFQMFGVQEVYDFYEENGVENPADIIIWGTSSDDYLLRKTGGKGFTLVCEMPYFYDKALDNDSESDHNRRKLRLDLLNHMQEVHSFVKPKFQAIRKYCDQSSRIFTSIADRVDHFDQRIAPSIQHAKTSPMYEGNATIAQAFDSQVASRYYLVFGPAMLARLYQDTMMRQPELKTQFESTFVELNHWVEQNIRDLLKGTDFEVIPIQKLVRVQVGSALIAIQNLV